MLVMGLKEGKARSPFLKKRTKKLLSVGGLKLAALLCASPVWAQPAKPVAVFPFQMMDSSGEGAPQGREARLRAATAELARALQASGRYRAVDLSARAVDIGKLQSPEECGECWAKLAAGAGATLEVLPSVHKVSTLITLMAIWVADVHSMKYVAHVEGQIRGDTAEAYTRGIDFLVREELLGKGHAP